MVGLQQVASVTKSGWTYFKITSFFLFFMIISIHAILLSIETGSIQPLYEEVGAKVFLSTQDLSKQAQDVINNPNIYEISQEHFIKDTFNIINMYAGFIISFWIVIVWIRVFAWIFSHSPFSFPDNDFVNYLAGLLMFLISQEIFILGIAALSHQVNNMKDLFEFMMIPLRTIPFIFGAALKLIMPASNFADKIVGSNETIKYVNMSLK